MYPAEQGIAVYFRDGTAAREAEQALRLSEERFRLLSKATSDVVWEWDMVTGAHSWNEGVTTLFGYTRAEIEPTIDFCLQRIHADDAATVNDVVSRAIASGAASWSGEYRFRRRDGGYTPVLDSGYIIRDGDGRPIRMLGGMKDLTERRHAEESLLLRDRAIQAASQGIVVTDPNQPDGAGAPRRDARRTEPGTRRHDASLPLVAHPHGPDLRVHGVGVPARSAVAACAASGGK